MEYYNQLKPIASKTLKRFKEDFTKHDRQQLKQLESNAEAIWAVRTTGTDLFLMNKNDIDPLDEYYQTAGDLKTIGAVAIEMANRNDKYYLLSNGEIKQISYDKAKGIINQYCRNRIQYFRMIRKSHKKKQRQKRNKEILATC